MSERYRSAADLTTALEPLATPPPTLGERFRRLLRRSEPTPLASLAPAHKPLDAVVHRLLAKRASGRYRSASDLTAALVPLAAPHGTLSDDCAVSSLARERRCRSDGLGQS